MTTYVDRPNTALLIVDVQRGSTREAHDRDAVIDRINDLLGRARRAGAPVVWVQHSDEHLVEGSDKWQYAAELERDALERLVHQHFGDAFDAHTLADPGQWGMPSSAEQVIAFTNSYWDEATAPGRAGGTVSTADVDFSAVAV